VAPKQDEEQSGLHRYPPFDTVLERLDGLPRKQARLARALLDEPEVIAFGSIREVAARLDVNAATVLRFAQVIGYSGYQTLQAAVRQAYLQYAGLQPPAEQRLLMQAGSALGHLRTHQRLDLDRLYERLDEDELQTLCGALEDARRVLVCGEGASSTLAALFTRLLRHAGIRAEHLPTGGADTALGLLGLGDEDVVIGISLGLPFRGPVDALRLGRRAGARTIAITGSAGSPCARDANHVVIAPSQGLGLSFSVTPTVALFETLVAMLTSRRPELVASLQRTLQDHYVEEGLVVDTLDPERREH
jgi:DNA-binding MurR/RpiR family transcriptional regulator